MFVSIIRSFGKITLPIFKINCLRAIIYRSSHVLDTTALYCLYNAIFQPNLSYCIEVWVNTYKNNINPVFIPHKKVIHIVCHARSLGHTYQLFYRLDILKRNDLIDFNTYIFMQRFSQISPCGITKEVFNVIK